MADLELMLSTCTAMQINFHLKLLSFFKAIFICTFSIYFYLRQYISYLLFFHSFNDV